MNVASGATRSLAATSSLLTIVTELGPGTVAATFVSKRHHRNEADSQMTAIDSE